MFKNNPIAQNALQLMLETKKNLYITGDAGTGKSTLLQEFLKQTKKTVAILAPTGMAAVNVGGETIHSFCKFGTEAGWQMLEENKIHKVYDSKRIKAVDVLVIDEVSMVRSDMLDCLDKFFRVNKGKTTKPFGDAQVILFGDHFQLPPILRNEEKQEFLERYETEHFFGAKVFGSLKLEYVKLIHNYRQSEEEFIKLLNYLRYGVSNSQLIDWINSRFLNQKNLSSKQPITITAFNKEALEINQLELSKIKTQAFEYNAITSGKFKPESYPVDKQLQLKIGAQVMFTKNDPDKRWVNGTIGTVTALAKEYINVKVKSKIITVEQAGWETYEFKYDEDKMELVKDVIGEFVQYPLKLAWAVTIHKSQGQTYDSCIINLGRGAFIYGQTYVAFSRCKTMEGIQLKYPIKLSDIKADPAVFHFDRGISWNK